MSLAAESKLERLIRSRELSGVFFFHGAPRLANEAARRLIDVAVDPATRDFNLDVFSGADVSAEAMASSLAMPPVMAERRVVALFGAEALVPTGRKVVEQALSTLPGDVTFVITATVPARTRAAFYTRLKQGATCMEWTAPRSSEIPGWIMERASSRHGMHLTPRVAQAIATAVGPDLGLLEAELEKLAALGQDDISIEQVGELIPNQRSVDRWSWLDRVAGREYGVALAQLPALISDSAESAVGLVGAMVEHHVFLGLALESGSAGVGRALQEAGKPYLKWKSRVFAGQAREWTRPEIDHALRTLLRADRQAKSGLRDEAVLQDLLLALQVEARACA